MATGLIALLDDVAGIARLAAASLDDAAGQAARAGGKAVGVVVDDTAVTPRYVVGLAAERELPIVGRIALGSLRNKLLYLLPGALALGLAAPWAITPLLMLGGAYLCFEGAEKVQELLWPHAAAAHGGRPGAAATRDPRRLEDERVRGAVRTDLVLSAEIMAITLATVADAAFWTQAFVLVVVGVAITALVYGVVALVVKADDAGAALAASGPLPARALGRALVRGMPVFLKILSAVGTAAMLWVGGGIIAHGLEGYGVAAPAEAVAAAAEVAAEALPATGAAAAPAAAGWLVTAAGYGLLGLAVGAVLVPLVQRVAAPALRKARA